MSADNLRKVVEASARKYARKCWWADEEDLRQQAWLIVLDAKARFERNFDPAKAQGSALESYCWRAAVIQLGIYLMKQSSPVSASESKDLAHLVQVSLDAPEHGRGDDGSSGGYTQHIVHKAHGTQEARADEELHHARWEAIVRSRMREICPPGDAGLALGLEALLAEERSGEVARQRDIDPNVVYTAKTKVKQMLANDPVIQRLHKER